MTTRIYHNPRCSKSRSALALLREKGDEPEIVLYLKDQPTAADIDSLCQALGIEASGLVRSKDRHFRELGLSLDDARDHRGWVEILAANPILIERPIVVRDGRAIIGRPPERVLELF